jgi:hypothetical protein
MHQPGIPVKFLKKDHFDFHGSMEVAAQHSTAFTSSTAGYSTYLNGKDQWGKCWTTVFAAQSAKFLQHCGMNGEQAVWIWQNFTTEPLTTWSWRTYFDGPFLTISSWTSFCLRKSTANAFQKLLQQMRGYPWLNIRETPGHLVLERVLVCAAPRSGTLSRY